MKTLFLILFILCGGLAPVSQNESEAVIKSIDSLMASVSRLSCHWDYHKTVSILQDEITASGSVEIDAGSSILKWNKMSPIQSELTFAPADVSGTSVTKDNRQIYRRISKFVNSRLNASTIADPKEFKTEVVREGSAFRVTMIPKSQEMQSLFTEIELLFDAKSLLLKKITLTDAESDITAIDIKSVKMER